MFPAQIKRENIRFLCSHGNLYTESMLLRNRGVLGVTMLFEKRREERKIVFLWKLECERDFLVLRLQFPSRFLFRSRLTVTIGRLSTKLELYWDGPNLMRGFMRQRTGHGGGWGKENRPIVLRRNDDEVLMFWQSEAHVYQAGRSFGVLSRLLPDITNAMFLIFRDSV